MNIWFLVSFRDCNFITLNHHWQCKCYFNYVDLMTVITVNSCMSFNIKVDLLSLSLMFFLLRLSVHVENASKTASINQDWFTLGSEIICLTRLFSRCKEFESSTCNHTVVHSCIWHPFLAALVLEDLVLSLSNKTK